MHENVKVQELWGVMVRGIRNNKKIKHEESMSTVTRKPSLLYQNMNMMTEAKLVMKIKDRSRKMLTTSVAWFWPFLSSMLVHLRAVGGKW